MIIPKKDILRLLFVLNVLLIIIICFLLKITNFKNHVNIELYPFLLRNITKIISKRHEFETESFYKGTGKKLGDSGEWATQYLLKEKLS